MNDEELISAYVDGRMSAPERAAFKARLQADAALRRQVALTRLLIDQSRLVESVPAPKHFILPQDYGKNTQPASQSKRFDWRLLFFRFGSVAAAMVFVSAVAFDALRTPPATMPAAAPMAAQAQITIAPEAAITTNIEPVTATEVPAQAPAGAMMVEATSMMQSRALPSDAISSMDMAVTVSPLDAITTAMTQTQNGETQNDGAQNATKIESLITPVRVIAGIALLFAILLGVLGWRRR